MSFLFVLDALRSRSMNTRTPTNFKKFTGFKRNFHNQHQDPFKYRRMHSKSQSNLKFQSTTQLLWSYFKAPTNLLFMSTNLLGLGIITTYRGLHTLANSDLTDLDHDNLLPPSLVEKSGIDWKEYNNEITKWKDIMEDRAARDLESREVNNLGIKKCIPLTEDDLLELGPEEIQDLPKDRVVLLMKNQLFELSQMYKEFRTILKKPKNYRDAEQLAYKRLCEYSGCTIPKDYLYNHSLKNENLYDHYRILQRPRNKLFSKINKKVTFDYMAKNSYIAKETISTEEFEGKFNMILKTFGKVESLQYRFLIKMSNLLDQYNDLDYLSIYKRLNSNKTNNENYKVLLNVISLSLLRQSSTFIKSEELFNEIMKNAILSKNKLIFQKCLDTLNLSSKDLKNLERTKRATKIVRQITKGNKLSEYSFSLESNISALKGLIIFNTPLSVIEKATKKVTASLITSEDNEIRVLYALPNAKHPSQKNKKETTTDAKQNIDTIPIQLLDLVAKVLDKSQDKYILTWYILAIYRNQTMSVKNKINRLSKVSKTCSNEHLKTLIERALDQLSQ